MCSGNTIGKLIFDPADLTGIFRDPVKTPKVSMDMPYTPPAAQLQAMSSAGTGAKVALGKQDKATRTGTGGLGSRTGGKSAVGGFSGGAGLKI